jgi:PAS domain S-box-containing protein
MADVSNRNSVPDDVTRLFAALANSPDPVFVTDRRNRIVSWNLSAERLLGYTADEIVGAACYEMLRGSDVYDNRYCVEACPVTHMASRSETIRHFDLHLTAKGGRDVLVDVSILNFGSEGADSFFLAHVLRPKDPSRTTQDRAASDPVSSRAPLASLRDSTDVRAQKLTAREVEVLGMLAAGHGTPELASRLHISHITVRNHIQNILDKLEVHSRTEAVAFAFQKRLL